MQLLHGMVHRPPVGAITALPQIKPGFKENPKPIQPKPPKKTQSDLTIDPQKDVLPEIGSTKKKRLASELSPILDNNREIEEALSQFSDLQNIIVQSLEHLQEYPYVPLKLILHSLRSSESAVPVMQKKLLNLFKESSIELKVTQEALHNFIENEIKKKLNQLKEDSALPQRGALVEPIEKFLKKLKYDRVVVTIYKNRLRKRFQPGADSPKKEESKQTTLPAINKYQMPPRS